MKRVKYDRSSLDSAIEAALRLESLEPLYVFATYHGFTIDHRKPPPSQRYVTVQPDGTVETTKGFAEEEEAGGQE